MTPRGETPPSEKIAAQESAVAAGTVTKMPRKRIEGWTHYYEYFHTLDAAMQVRDGPQARAQPGLRAN